MSGRPECSRLECSHYNGRLPLAGGLHDVHAARSHRPDCADDLPELRLKPREEKRLAAGHLWVFSNEVDTARTPLTAFAPGALCRVVARSRSLPRLCLRQSARADLRAHPRSRSRASARQVAVRAPAAGRARAARAAVRRRRSIGSCTANPTACRASCSTGSATSSSGRSARPAWKRCKADIVAAVEKVIAPRAFIWKNDSGARELEGLAVVRRDRERRGRRGSRSSRKTACAFSCRWARARRPAGSTTRPPTAARCSSTSRARACSTCSAISAPGASPRPRAGATEVLCVDSSAPALELLQRSAAANALDACAPCATTRSTRWRRLREAGEKFDVVIIDPPAFIKRRKDIPKGQAAYRKLNQLAMQVLARDGILVSCSCSHHLAHRRPGRARSSKPRVMSTASRRSSKSAVRRPTIRSIRRSPRRAT